MSAFDDAFLDERIAQTKALIVAYEGALLALAGTGGVQSYTLDTGQTRQTVTKADVGSLRNSLQEFYSLLSMLESRKCGGAVHMRPTF